MADQETINHHYKNRILTELFNSGIIQAKIPGACHRNNVRHHTYIHEDVEGEVFLHMSKLKAEDIIEMYEDDGVSPTSRLVRLATRIMSLQGFAKKKGDDYPKQSVMTNILFASNLNKTTGSYSGSADAVYLMEYDEYTEEVEFMVEEDEKDFLQELWKFVKENLSDEDNAFLEALFTGKKKRGKYKKEITDRLEEIKNKIRQIVEEAKIKI